MTNLNILREQIDEIDSKLIDLFTKRFELVKKIGKIKKENGIKNPLDSKRWEYILQKISNQADSNGISKDFINIIWNEIHKESLRLEK